MTLKFLYILPATKTFAGIERVVDDICSELAVRYGDELEVDVMFTSLYKDAIIQQRYNRIDAPISGRWDLLRKIRRVVSQKRYDLVIVPQVEPTVLTYEDDAIRLELTADAALLPQDAELTAAATNGEWDEYAKRLQKQGMDISRRTVAKYRDQLGIPSSNRRKTF